MPSSLPVAFSIRQKLPTSASQLLVPTTEMLVVPPRPSAVRHRLRAVLPETTADAEAESHDILLNHTSVEFSTAHHSHQPEPAIALLVKDLPAESVLLLNLVAVIWGSQHPIIKMVVDDCDPAAFSLVRFGFAALIASLFSPQPDSSSVEKDDARTVWRWGAEMGLWMLLGYAFQAIGLEYTTAQRSGFLLYLNVKFVPFFARIFLGRQISIPTWVSAFVAVLGTALLSYDGSSLSLNVGDLWSIAAAGTSAMFILRLEAATAAVSNSAALNAACLWVVTIGSLLWTLAQGYMTAGVMETVPRVWDNVVRTMSLHPVELVYLSAVTTALANYIQTKAQRNVSAERASVIYAMDPVYGAVFSYWLLGERLSDIGMVGAALITVAAATNAFLDLGKKETLDDDEEETMQTES